MYFESLRLSNFGPHLNTTLKFQPRGINFVFGVRGSGKTQMTGAVLFALFGYDKCIQINRDRLNEQPCFVELVLRENEDIEIIKCELANNGEFAESKLPLRRSIIYPPSNSRQVALHRQITDFARVAHYPRLLLETWERNHELVLPSFLKLELVTEALQDKNDLSHTWKEIQEFLISQAAQLPHIGSAGLSAMLKIVEEFTRRSGATQSIPLMIDGGFDYLDIRAARVASKLIENLSVSCQIILLSASPEPIDWFSSDNITSYTELKWNGSEWKPASVFYDWSASSIGTLDRSQLSNEKTLIVTEGKTDWKHLKTALKRFKLMGEFTQLEVEFSEFGEDVKMGSRELLKLCETISKFRQKRKTICIFDRDEPDIITKVTRENLDYKHWGNNVYSIVLPIPDHRREQTYLCIEMCYRDHDLMKQDKNGRRLFLSSEFSPKSGRHLTEKSLTYAHAGRIRENLVSIIDESIFSLEDKNVALPKDDFANYVYTEQPGFDDFDVSGFRKVFLIISSIIRT